MIGASDEEIVTVTKRELVEMSRQRLTMLRSVCSCTPIIEPDPRGKYEFMAVLDENCPIHSDAVRRRQERECEMLLRTPQESDLGYWAAVV
jgi:hypothetical protein